jgi:hypothetical protein
MNKKALHIWGITEKNFGDIVIGDATKYWFHRNIDKTVLFDNATCRKLYDNNRIKKINTEYDYLIVGAGGLILPDTHFNNNSCWQWDISDQNILKIEIPIYVVSIGYNLFYNQSIDMNNNKFLNDRIKKFNKNISTLIDHSKYFSIRHHGDIELLKQHVPIELHTKIKFQFCPTIDYTKFLVKKLNIQKKQNNVWAFEIKEDRKFKRFYNTTQSEFYSNIVKFINYIKTNKPDIELVILNSHKNNNTFQKYLKNNNIIIPIIQNYNLDNETMIKNLINIDRLYCMGGHSQMIGYACGCDIRSIITHNKLKFFLEDIDKYKNNLHIEPNLENTFDKLIATIES